jgi:hypothetical protein
MQLLKECAVLLLKLPCGAEQHFPATLLLQVAGQQLILAVAR